MGLPPIFLPVPDMTMLGEEDTEAVLLPLIPALPVAWEGGGEEKGKAEEPLRAGVERCEAGRVGWEGGEDGGLAVGAVGIELLPTAGLSLILLLLLPLLLLLLLLPPPDTGIGLATRKSTP
jgi:hypothetical protein